MAVGMLEVQGFGIALACADAMCKTANISIEAFDANNPTSPDAMIPVIVQVKIRGGISDIYAALEAGRREAGNFLTDDEIITKCIPMETEEILPLIQSGKLMPREAESEKKETVKTVRPKKEAKKESDDARTDGEPEMKNGR